VVDVFKKRGLHLASIQARVEGLRRYAQFVRELAEVDALGTQDVSHLVP
jgi:hypothetical protein